MRRNSAPRLRGIVAILVLMGCRSHAPSWPNETPDLVGQVVEVRSLGSLSDAQGIAVQSERPATAMRGIRRLRIRVIGSRRATPGTYAYIGMDGSTQVARGDAQADVEEGRAVEGAFVRVWFRGVPQAASPTELTAMARVIAVDSLGRQRSGQ